MNEQEERRAIHQAVDARLSGMAGNPRLAQQIIDAEGKPKMKKKVSLGLILALVLALVSMGALAAALYPRTVEQFSETVGPEFGARLSNGDIADLNSRHGDGWVDCTVTDVIWEGGVLYGTVVMEPAAEANVILLPEEIEHYAGENLADCLMPDGKATYAQAAQEKGAKLVKVSCLPDGYVLDGENLSGTVGYFSKPQEDGSIVAAFELHGWNGAIQRAKSYTLEMTLRTIEMSPDGQEDAAHARLTRFTLDVKPRVNADQKETITQLSADGIPVETPRDYDGTMDVYAVTRRSGWQVNPDWFNASGVAREEKGEYSTVYTFNDEDQLTVDTDGYLYLSAYAGTETVMYETADGERVESEPMPRNEGAKQAYDLIGSLCFDGGAEKPDAALPEVTLAEAQAVAEALLEKLGVQMTCSWRYAADAATLTELNEAKNGLIRNGELLNCNVWEAPFTAADEGYYLAYEARMAGAAAEEMYAAATLYVTRDGVRCCVIREPFLPGESQGKKQLISAEEALSRAAHAAKKSWLSVLGPALKQAKRIELIYTVQNQSLLLPAWRITAPDPEATSGNGYDFQVVVSAVDGTVLNGPWM